MKKILFALAGSAIFAVAAASAPAAAMPIPATPIGTISNVEQVQWGHPSWHGHPHGHGIIVAVGTSVSFVVTVGAVAS